MMKRAALFSLTLSMFATAARADETTTTTAGTLVVVTPSAPIVVQTNGAAAPAAAAVADPALAPPGVTLAPPSTAPQNEDWSNVSHINGVPIKVGERGDYLYKFKKVNISADPFGLFFGYYDVAASYALSQNVALSVSMTGWSTDSSSGYQATVSLPIYFRRTYSGPYLEPGLIMRSTNDNGDSFDCDDCGSGGTSSNDTWAGPELLFGWHWTFDSGLNIAMAAGVAKHATDNQGMDYSDSSTEPVGYFRVGYAF